MCNATYLFIEPHRKHHHSESYWTSLFSLYLLYLSKTQKNTSLPAFKLIKEDGQSCFRPDGYLHVPKDMDFSNIIVEGRFGQAAIPDDKNVEIPKNLLNLKPDIFIVKNDQIIIIEVKTIGSYLTNYQKERYEEIYIFLIQRGYKLQLYFLLSAGHEQKNIDLLEYHPSNISTYKILLWEHIFKHMYENNSESSFCKCLGDISRYYKDEKDYMKR